ncbi:hypothetical protein PR048_032427 [Dryococelus australis]|uniref:Uncharacterized protein n=1 Tax=Dryococelus australis TaxID=614101 RepID=A0ABQ9G2Z0_9NEOP|nr:hypothetical protein PR048_032427 [Dryococelus australis]
MRLTEFLARRLRKRGHGGWAVSLLASHQGDPGSIPVRVTPDFRMWESCRTMPLVAWFSWGSPVSPAISFRRCSILASITLISSQDLDVKSRPNLFTHSRDIIIVDPQSRAPGSRSVLAALQSLRYLAPRQSDDVNSLMARRRRTSPRRVVGFFSSCAGLGDELVRNPLARRSDAARCSAMALPKVAETSTKFREASIFTTSDEMQSSEEQDRLEETHMSATFIACDKQSPRPAGRLRVVHGRMSQRERVGVNDPVAPSHVIMTTFSIMSGIDEATLNFIVLKARVPRIRDKTSKVCRRISHVLTPSSDKFLSFGNPFPKELLSGLDRRQLLETRSYAALVKSTRRKGRRDYDAGARQGDSAKGPRDKIDVKHVYTEVDFAAGSRFVRLALSDSEPVTDLHEVSVEQRQNARARETGDPRGKPAAKRRHATIPTCENPGVSLPGIEPGSPSWDASGLTTSPPRLLFERGNPL